MSPLAESAVETPQNNRDHTGYREDRDEQSRAVSSSGTAVAKPLSHQFTAGEGESPVQIGQGPEDQDQWRVQALRLQAEMDNYRKRQRRLAQDQIQEERFRLLGAFLSVVDDLERALEAQPADGMGGLRRGVQLTHRSALRLLDREGVERIEAQDEPFDPNWHEAVSTLKRDSSGLGSDTVVQVLEPGYRLGERLLRPARVVVTIQGSESS